jgi:hypothetical protein
MPSHSNSIAFYRNQLRVDVCHSPLMSLRRDWTTCMFGILQILNCKLRLNNFGLRQEAIIAIVGNVNINHTS